MSAVALKQELDELGIELAASLRYRPKSKVTDDLKERLEQYKGELLAMLLREEQPFDPNDADDLWQATLDQLERDSDIPADVLEGLRAAEVHWEHAPRPEAVEPWQCRCGSQEYIDVPIHNGRSTRRDCAQCGKFIDFVKWNVDC